ncbi:MAG: twin-arginine translocation signal domain-containing protein [Acidothermaceae bacterium]
MVEQSRRDFLKTASLGAAVAGVAVASPRILTSDGPPTQHLAAPAAAEAPVAGNSLMAYVRDPNKGEIALFVGERETTFRDVELATRLARAAQQD